MARPASSAGRSDAPPLSSPAHPAWTAGLWPADFILAGTGPLVCTLNSILAHSGSAGWKRPTPGWQPPSSPAARPGAIAIDGVSGAAISAVAADLVTRCLEPADSAAWSPFPAELASYLIFAVAECRKRAAAPSYVTSSGLLLLPSLSLVATAYAWAEIVLLPSALLISFLLPNWIPF